MFVFGAVVRCKILAEIMTAEELGTRVEVCRNIRPWAIVRIVTGMLHEHPFGASLDELVKQHAQVCEHEAADIKAEELGRVSGAEFKTDLRLVSMS